MKISEILNPDKQKSLKGEQKEKTDNAIYSLAEIARKRGMGIDALRKELNNMEGLRGLTIEQMEARLRVKAEKRGKTIAQILAKWRHNRNYKRNRALRNEKELQRDISRS